MHSLLVMLAPRSVPSLLRFVVAVGLAAWLSPPGSAGAQDQGFALNRFDIAEVGSDWFAGDSLDLRGGFRPGIRLAIDWAHNPLLRYDQDGNAVASIIEDQLHGHAGLSVVIAERLRLAANQPVVLSQGGQPATVNGVTFGATTGTALGDLRLALDLRVAGEYGGPISLALGVQAHAPTGDRAAFAGDGELRLTPRLMIAGDLSAFAYSLRAAFTYRPQDAGLGPVPTGNEMAFVATAGVRAAGGVLLLGPELWGSTLVGNPDTAFRKDASPFELLMGAHLRVGGFSAGVGAGPGLNRGLGAPEVRVVGTIAFVPEPGSDRDGDGIDDEDDACPDLAGPESRIKRRNGCPDRDGDDIIDPEDACPDEPGVRSDDPSKNGCPRPRDRDGDGVLDREDACPDVPGVRSDDPTTNGCPPDRDGDGIQDDQDACPDVPGVPNDDPRKHGCPPDRDGDGIPDAEDACPNEPGLANPDPAQNGCPLARVEKDQIVISQRIEFEFDKARLVPSSTPVLEAVLAILEEHHEIEEVLVEGHTDDVGKAAYNKKLSGKRAAAVVKWFVDHGVERGRLRSAGVGKGRPIASNEDEVGRQKNRRVEFHIERGEVIEDAPGAKDEQEAPTQREHEQEQEQEPTSEPKPKPKPRAKQKAQPSEPTEEFGDDPATW